jgi:hypothetical protein
MDTYRLDWTSAPRLILFCVVVMASTATPVVSQTEADKIASLERARVAAIMAGRNLSPFYNPVFVNIRADGSTENVQQTGRVAEGSLVKLDSAFRVRVYRVAAVVIGVEWIGTPPVAHCFLRIWTGLGDGEPKVAVSQLTAITGEAVPDPVARAERSVVGPIRTSNPPCHGIRGALDSDLKRDELLDRRDFAAYGALTAAEFVYVDSTGRLLQRAEYLRDLSSSESANAKIIRGRQFKACDLAVLFVRREGSSAIDRPDLIELETRVLAEVSGIWRQVAIQTTPILASSLR